jgi:P pilus assembly chaperone PapD
MKKPARFITLALSVAAALLLPMKATSQGLGLDVSPAKFEVAIPAGQAYNIPITVHNSSGDPTHVQATLVDFGVDPNGGYQFQKVGSRQHSLLRWASIRPREFDLPAGTSQQVQLSVVVPSQAGLSGEYAGIVFFQTRPTRRGGSTLAFSARVASKIYETIPDTVKVEGMVAKMASSKAGNGQSYRVVFNNTGNAHVYLRGQVQVQKGGSVVDRIAMPDEMLVERGGTRTIQVSGKRLAPGTYQAIATIDYGGKTQTGGAIEFTVP